MKEKRYTSLVIGHDTIVGIVGYKKVNTYIIENLTEMARKGSIYEDTSYFLDYYGQENSQIACVGESKMYTDYMEIPKLTSYDVFTLAKEEGRRRFTEKDKSLVIDYATRDHKDGKLLTIVALGKEKIKEMARGIQKGKGDLRIIDYWPAPLVYAHGLESSMLCIIESNEDVLVSLWSRSFCIGHGYVKLDMKEIETTCTNLVNAALELGIDFPKGVAVYTNHSDKEKVYELLLETYGDLPLVNYHLVGSGLAFKPYNIYHAMALGLVIRNINYGKR